MHKPESPQIPTKPVMIALATDFGPQGLYTGQMQIALAEAGLPIINLIADLPPFQPGYAGQLLAALAGYQPTGLLYLAVVDPGVGGDRAALLMETEKAWYLGPDNGLFAATVKRFPAARIYRIGWRPVRLSASFHGRDLFAAAAVRFCHGEDLELCPVSAEELVGLDWEDEIREVIYVDRYGNLITGLSAERLAATDRLLILGANLGYARTFSEVAPGELFWYENSIGLVEIAANMDSAALRLNAGIGTLIEIADQDDAVPPFK